MPKKSNKQKVWKQSRGNPRSGRPLGPIGGLRDQNRVTRVTGRQIVNTGVATAAGTVTVTEYNFTIAALGDRIIAIGDTFMYWRMVRMHYYQDVQVGVFTSGVATPALAESYSHAAAFIPMSNSNYVAPTTLVQIVDFPEFQQGNGLRRVALQVANAGLIGSMMMKWLTVNTTSDSDAQSAGTLTVVSISGSQTDATAASIRGVLEFDVEFREPIDTALVPMSNSQRLHDKTKPRPLVNRSTRTSPNGTLSILVDDVGVPAQGKGTVSRREELKGEPGWTASPFALFR